MKVDCSREIFGVGIQYFYSKLPSPLISFTQAFLNPFHTEGTIHV